MKLDSGTTDRAHALRFLPAEPAHPVQGDERSAERESFGHGGQQGTGMTDFMQMP